MTILAASTETQYASEENGSGIFTTLLVDALAGAASNLVGDVTPGSVYAHVDQSLGPWQQRPVFKTNVKRFVSLRRVLPPLPLQELRLIAKLFPAADFDFRLDPTFEPELRGRPEGAPPPDPRDKQLAEQAREIAKWKKRAERAEALVEVQKKVAALLGTPFESEKS